MLSLPCGKDEVKHRLCRSEAMAVAIVKVCALHKVKLSLPLTSAETSQPVRLLHLRSKLHASQGALSYKKRHQPKG